MKGTLTRYGRAVLEPVAQLGLFVRESISLRGLLLNRFTVILGLLALATVGANAYMENTDGNQLTGTVVTTDGTPVGNATVEVRVAGIENVVHSGEAVTDEEGRFVIEGYMGPGDAAGIELRIRVTTEDGYQSPTHFRHAYFPKQNLDVRIVIDPDGSAS